MKTTFRITHPRWLAAGIAVAALAAGSGARADDCVRSAPFPIFALDRHDIGAHTFTPANTHEASERFILPLDMHVEVTHGGCEYFVTTLRVESAALFARRDTSAEVYRQAALLLEALRALRADTAFDLSLVARTLRRQAARRPAPALGQEVAVSGDGEPPLQAGVKIGGAGRRNGAGWLEVTLFRGPL